jgi:hypothetical protein
MPGRQGGDACPSCGSAVFERYCAQCGERRLDRSDFRVRRYLGEAFASITEADSRVWRSFRALLFRPGLLSAEYVAGRRRPWIGPVQLFLLCNVVFFVVLEFMPVHVFTTRLSDHLLHHPYSEWALAQEARAGVTFRELHADPAEFAVYARTFDAVTAGLAKSLIFVMIPGVAALLALLHIGRRRYFVEHLTLATHYFAVLLLGLLAVLLFLLLAAFAFDAFGVATTIGDDDSFSSMMLVVLAAWLVPAMRRFYRQHWVWATLKFAVFIVAFVWILFGYRLLLFVVTIRAV